ncbi:MAG: TolC family protein [Armatimonadota bacterium]
MKHLRRTLIVLAVTALGAGGGWAQEIEPLTLAESVDHALAHNPRLSAARERIEATASRIGQASAAMRPQLDARAGYTDSEPAGRDLRNYSALLSARQLLYDSGETDARTAQARSQRDAIIADLRALELDIANTAATEYFGALRARRLVEVAVEVRDQAREHHSLAKARYEAGTVARADVLRAEVEVARAHLDVISAEKTEELARARLRKTLGIGQDRELRLADIEPTFPPVIDRATAFGAARTNRSELIAIDAEIAAGEAAVRAAKASSRPEVALQGDWGARENDFPPGDEAWTIGLTASTSIFDGGLTRKRVDEARANVRVLQADRDEQARLIDLEIAEALLNEREARQRIELAEEEVALARHSMEVSSGRYRVGEATQVELIDTRTALSRALATQAEALYDYHRARADVARAMGLLPGTEAYEELPQE